MVICIEDYQECEKCDRKDCMIKTLNEYVVEVKEK